MNWKTLLGPRRVGLGASSSWSASRTSTRRRASSSPARLRRRRRGHLAPSRCCLTGAPEHGEPPQEADDDTGGEERADLALNFQDWVNMFQFGGIPYSVQGGNTPSASGEKIEANFRGYVDGAYKANGVVFACMLARMLLFAEARFQFRRQSFGRPGDLFGTQELSILETPWPGATTGDLLSRMEQDSSLAGNFYGARRRADLLQRLRPDWVTIVTGSRTGSELDTELVGYMYEPGGPTSGEDPVVLLPEHVAHYAPIPDPIARFRGMSWLTPIVEEINADSSATIAQADVLRSGRDARLRRDARRGHEPAEVRRVGQALQGGPRGLVNAYKTCSSPAARISRRSGPISSSLTSKRFRARGRPASPPPQASPRRRRTVRGVAGGDVLELRAGPPPVRGSDDAPAVAQRRRVARPDRHRPARERALVRRP
jgi:hypothetical protein